MPESIPEQQSGHDDYYTRLERTLNRVEWKQDLMAAQLRRQSKAIAAIAKSLHPGGSDLLLNRLAEELDTAADALQSTIDENKSTTSPVSQLKGSIMASPVLTNLSASVTKITGVAASAKALIEGFSTRLQAAIDAALANGATEAELVPVQAEVDALNASATELAAAVAANP